MADGNRLGIDIDYIYDSLGGFNRENMTEAIRLCKKYGFRNLDYLSTIEGDDYLDAAKFWRDEIEKNGLTVHQSHAPSFRYSLDKSLDEYKVALSRALDVAIELGTRYFVVHGDEYRLKENEVYDPEKILAFCRELFAPYVERARKNNISVAFENLFEDVLGKRFTSDIDELLSLVDVFGKDSDVSICWDFGHANVAYKEGAIDAFKKAFPRITCTHVHDNYHGDDHLLPTLGLMDWKSYMSYMRENGYKGNITFELVYGRIPREIMDDFLSFARSVGEYLLSL